MIARLSALVYFHLREPRLLPVGAAAPPFEAPDQHGRPVRLSDFAGRRLLLWFFPRALTAGCTVEGCGFRDQLHHFEEFNTEVVGVSFDRVETNRRFCEVNHFPYRILSDSARQIGIRYGACLNAAASMPKRVSYLIDGQQRILYCWSKVEPALHPSQVINTIYANFYRTFEES